MALSSGTAYACNHPITTEILLADVFLSYARSDRSLVERLAASLDAGGFETWWDRKIIGGEDFSERIESELNRAGAVVVAWSAAGNRSNWVKDEASVAALAGKLVAVTLDGSVPPLGYRQYHCIDLSDWLGNSDDSGLAELTRALSSRLCSPAGISNDTNSDTDPDLPPEVPVQTPDRISERSDGALWIAVTPLKVRGSHSELPDMADELAGTISSGLARFSWLNVASQPSSLAGREAGAAYLLEGSLRASGEQLRLSMRLGDTRSGKQVWGEDFNRDFDPDNVFDLQDDLTDHVVTAVADPHGALMRDLSAPVLHADPHKLTPYQALIRYFVYRQRVSVEDYRIAFEAVEHAVTRAPGDAELLAALSLMYLEEFKHGYNEREEPLKLAHESARKAIELDSQSAHAWFALADICFFLRDVATGRNAGLRTLELNPRDSDAMAMIGTWFCFTDDYPHGLKMVERARRLNPSHPGWYWIANFFHHFRKGEFEQALEYAKRVNMPQYFVYHELIAATLGWLGDESAAAEAAARFLEVLPLPAAQFEELLNRWHYLEPDVVDLLMNGLRKAGVEF
jgi:TolB-like protein